MSNFTIYLNFSRYAGYCLIWRRWLNAEYQDIMPDQSAAIVAEDFTIRMTGGFVD